MKLKDINVHEQMKHYHVNGLSISFIEKSRITGTENYGLLESSSDRNVSNDSIFNACSISKFLTGMLALKLLEDGHFGLDEDVNKRLVTWKVPENEYTKNKKVTLRNLLSHQSGIKDPKGSFSELRSDIGPPSMLELLQGKSHYCKVPIEVTFEPESEFHYSDAGYCIVQQLIEDVMKKPFYQVMNEYIFKPLRMESSFLPTTMLEIDNNKFSCGHDRNGQLVEGKYPIYPYPSASGLWTSSLDLALIVLELMNALNGESEIGISKSLVQEMITPQRGKCWTGLGVFLEGSAEDLEITSMGWGIGFQCMLVAYPNLGKGAVIMTNAELGVHQMDGIIGEIYKSIR
ncbi:serine hydrolase domain-containing protein [Bacillus sinesaloumensis]|uniref:serine hydrolase domain-containing protein n=1 Tax=Litchfieldia sinesaloumensis TaxID=1926280 RepID=UPI0009888DC4|nr:serine hydrolase domain-containing protein [Bacillus sinesaloumensis]